LQRGLRLFAGGAKVYVVNGFGGDGWETLTVIGRHRKAGRYLTAHVPAEHLTNWRVKPIYIARPFCGLCRRNSARPWLVPLSGLATIRQGTHIAMR
jgi:hypothetical protein